MFLIINKLRLPRRTSSKLIFIPYWQFYCNYDTHRRSPLPYPLDQPYKVSIHLMASLSETLPRYLCVVERSACLRSTLLTISIGTPDLETYVAAWRRRSWGLSLIPTISPTFIFSWKRVPMETNSSPSCAYHCICGIQEFTCLLSTLKD